MNGRSGRTNNRDRDRAYNTLVTLVTLATNRLNKIRIPQRAHLMSKTDIWIKIEVNTI